MIREGVKNVVSNLNVYTRGEVLRFVPVYELWMENDSSASIMCMVR